MKLVNEVKTTVVFSETYEGTKGKACITKNLGVHDMIDHFEVSVLVNGKYKCLAKRARYEKAIAMAKDAID